MNLKYYIKGEYILMMVIVAVIVAAIVIFYISTMPSCGDLLIEKAEHFCLANCKLCSFG